MLLLQVEPKALVCSSTSSHMQYPNHRDGGEMLLLHVELKKRIQQLAAGRDPPLLQGALAEPGDWCIEVRLQRSQTFGFVSGLS